MRLGKLHNIGPALIITGCLLLTLAAIAEATEKPLNQVRAYLDDGVYRSAHQLLEKALRRRDLPMEERLEMLTTLATFYENQVGDDRRALKVWQRIIATASADASPAAIARQAADRIEARLRRLGDLEKRLHLMRVAAVQPGRHADKSFHRRMQRQQKELRQIKVTAETAPLINYTLGLTLLALDRPFSADRAFGRVLKQRPAYGLFQPVGRLQQTARHNWIRRLLKRTAGTILVLFWVGVAAGVGLARPWRWMHWRHLAAGVIMAVIWTAVFQTALHWPGRQEAAASFINRDGFYPTPTYVHTRPGAAESEVADRLFYYGLTMISGIYLLAVSTAGIGRPSRRRMICGVASLAFGLALMTQFYYTHCENQSRLYRRNDTARAWLSAQLAFRSSEPEPYLLTDPKSYPGVELASISDPLLVEWLQRHLPDARLQTQQRRND
jgi:tetratricopeptide (TPR) repeat protein